ncbi:hypothetical protein [Streptomyces sp. NBC_00467]|uniref:hypothetical protein n=1 Tax=Streptomyces sp. NBC_00467 TaxID=2975752 RepID=UPI002E1864F4
MAISRARVTLITTLTAATVAIAGIATFGVANAAPQDAETPSATEIPLAVEDFTYPGAAQIQQDQQIVLKRGDGHITLASCEGTTDIMVKSRTGKKSYCFDVNAKQGYLTLEVPDAFGIWTEAYPVTATITVGSEETVVRAAANDYQPIGEAGDNGERSVLVELRVTG